MISESGRSPGEGIGYPLQSSWASPGGSNSKESACNAGSIPGLGRSLEEDMANSLQYSCPENLHGEEPGGLQSIGVAKSQTRLSDQAPGLSTNLSFGGPGRMGAMYLGEGTRNRDYRPHPMLP